MPMAHRYCAYTLSSPSSRRAWVEMARTAPARTRKAVALLTEGVGRNSFLALPDLVHRVALLTEGVGRNSAAGQAFSGANGRPPHGGRG